MNVHQLHTSDSFVFSPLLAADVRQSQYKQRIRLETQQKQTQFPIQHVNSRKCESLAVCDFKSLILSVCIRFS